jgi:cytidylate kinase
MPGFSPEIEPDSGPSSNIRHRGPAVRIAIDGPAASGKGTLSRRLAAHYGIPHLDTGSLYRAVGAMVLAAGGHPSDPAAALGAARRLDPDAVEALDIRSSEAGRAASIVAAMPEVRAELLRYQRRFAKGGAVLDGRDIGTVVLPDADVKLFVVASAEARARRRGAELRAAGTDISDAAVLADLTERDARDSGRTVSPLARAADAHLLDTTDLDIEAAFQAALALIEGRHRTGAG